MRFIAKLAMAAAALAAGIPEAGAQTPMETIYISELYTSHMVFSTDITYADVSNTTDIAAMIVEQNKNMLALRARAPFTTTASVTVLESNGVIHTYIIAYNQKPAQLVMDTRGRDAQPEYRMETNSSPSPAPGSSYAQEPAPGSAPAASLSEVTAGPGDGESPRRQRRNRKEETANEKTAPSGVHNQDGGSFVSNLRKQDAPLLKDVINYPQELYHISSRFQKVEITCENIFAYSDITYVTLRLKNRSGVSYETEDAMFVILENSKQKRKIKPEPKVLLPKNRYGTLTAAPGEEVKIVYSFEKVTLSRDQTMDIYIYEKGGERNLVLTLGNQDVNLASLPKTR